MTAAAEEAASVQQSTTIVSVHADFTKKEINV